MSRLSPTAPLPGLLGWLAPHFAWVAFATARSCTVVRLDPEPLR